MNYFVHKSSYIDQGAEIGEGTKIWYFCHVQSRARIGKYAMVAAGAVVTRNVEAYSLVAGIPAKVIGKVDEQGNIISRMENISI